MRLPILVVLTLFSINAVGQRIEFRNDSLFIDHYYVNGLTSWASLDSLLQSHGRERKGVGKYKPGTTEIDHWQSYTYRSKGLVFTKFESDSTRLMIGIKLHRNENPVVDQNNLPTSTFKGQLYIAGNYMNDKRELTQLQQLPQLAITLDAVVTGRIFYRQKSISVVFDFMTKLATCIFIDW